MSKVNMIAGQYTAYAFESVTVSTTSIGLTAGNFDNNTESVKRIIITIESAQIRWRYDGGAPTASVGHLNNPFDTIILVGRTNISNFRAIRAGSTDATIRVTFERS